MRGHFAFIKSPGAPPFCKGGFFHGLESLFGKEGNGEICRCGGAESIQDHALI